MSGLSAEGFRALLDGGVEGIHVIDARDGRLVEVNEVSCARLGYSRAELLGLTVFDIVASGTPVDPVQWEPRVAQIRRQEGGLRSRGLLRRKDGALLAIEVSLACRSHGDREYVVAVWRPADPGQSQALRQEVFRRVRHVIDGMQSEGDMSQLLTAVRRGLQEMGLRFDNCGVNLVEDGPQPRQRAFTYRRDGTWLSKEFVGERIAPFMRLWRAQKTAYRPDIEREDTLDEKAWLSSPLRAIIDIPFPLGTLALSSREPDPFSAEDIDLLAEMAQILNDGLRRLGDLKDLREHAARLEESNRALEGQIAVRHQLESVQRVRLRVFELLARGAELDRILAALVEVAQTANPDMLASVLLVDEQSATLRLGAAPDLPDFYNAGVDGVAIGPGQGSCGTAAHTGGRVVVEDIATHPYWEAFRDLAARAGLAACWSEPVVAADGAVLGTVALYFRQPRSPAEADLDFMREMAQVAAVAIQRQRAAADLHRNQVFLRSVLANVPLLVWVIDLDGTFTLSEGKGLEAVGLKPGEVVGRRLDEIYREHPALIEATRRTLEGEEQAFVMRFGPGRVWDIHYTPFRDEGGAVSGALGVAFNVSKERRQQQERLVLQQARNEVWRMETEDDIEKVMGAAAKGLRQIDIPFDGASVTVIDDGQDPPVARHHIFLNNELSKDRWIRLQTNLGTSFFDEVRRSGAPLYRPDLAAADPYGEAESLASGFGHPVLAVVDVPFSHGVLAFNSRQREAFLPEDIAFFAELAEVLGGGFSRMDDLANLRHKEEALRQAQKMEAIGELTAGVAHNFNNILQGVYGNLLLARDEAAGVGTSFFDAAETAVRSAADLIAQLMMFTRQGQRPRIEAIDVADLAGRVADICRQTFDRKIAISIRMPTDLPAVRGARNQLEQAFLNLCLNARDAFSGIEDRAPAISITGELIGSVPPPAAGPYVRLRFADNGAGMPEAVRRRVFDPFFTTKEKGTGLGLSTVFGIVADCGGWVECESTPGAGTVFSLFLPPSAGPVPAPALPARPGQLPGGSETVLVVDDEETVRLTLVGLLQKLGYRVLQAADGAEGLEMWRAHPEVDLVLLDMSMPRLSGMQVLQTMRAESNTAKVLCITGHAGRDCPEGADGVVAKPFSLDRIARRARQVLDA